MQNTCDEVHHIVTLGIGLQTKAGIQIFLRTRILQDIWQQLLS